MKRADPVIRPSLPRQPVPRHATVSPTAPSRRGFLRGVLAGSAVAVGLPWLETTAKADDGFPQRFVIWQWGNGNRPERWTPTGEGSAYALSDALLPLAALQHRLSVVTGLSVLYTNRVPHWSGLGGILTGAEVSGDDGDWWVNAPTLDTLAAAAIGNDTIYRSLQVGVDTDDCFSWNGTNAQNPGEKDPYALFERLFGPTFVEPGSGGLVDPALGFRRSVLDAVIAESDALKARVSASDRVRLDQHLTGLRELELRLARLEEDPPSYEACERPEPPLAAYPDLDGRPQLVERNAAQSALVAMALACDLTRVVNVQFSAPLNNTLFPDATDGHHNQTHNEGGDQPEVAAITEFCIENLAAFASTLEAVQEGSSTLLDHSLVLAVSDVSEARTHSLDEMPVLLLGSANGRIRNGEHVRYTRQNSNALGLSVLRSLGLVLPSFGAGDYAVTDGLAEIEV